MATKCEQCDRNPSAMSENSRYVGSPTRPPSVTTGCLTYNSAGTQMVSCSRWISLWILIKGHLRGAGTPDLSGTSRSWFLNKPMTRLLCPVIQPEPVYRRNFFRSNPANYLRHLNPIQHIYMYRSHPHAFTPELTRFPLPSMYHF